MKSIFIAFTAIIGIALFSLCCVMSSQNGAIGLEETVKSAQSAIDVQLTNRFNKFHELAECVKKYDEHEYKSLCDVIAQRGKNMSGKDAKQCIAAFSRVEERYPDLKSHTNYKHLMNEISITENHLSQIKIAYNNSVKDYNYHCRKFPTSMFLSLVGYQPQHFNMYAADESVKDNKPITMF